MPSTMPLRVGDDLLASAKVAAETAGRSTAQQIGYWAKLGRELERSGSVSVREIAEVLAGARSYDDLDPKAQAKVRGECDERIDARRASLNLAERFRADGRSWVEAGADGATVRHGADDQGGPSERHGRVAAAETRSGRSRTTQRSPRGDAGDGRNKSAQGTAAAKTTKRTEGSKSATKVAPNKASAKTKASSRSR